MVIYMNNIEKLEKIINESNNIVALCGAGISTESGLKDFRGNNGLNKQNKFPYPVEEILSHHFFENNAKEFFKYYKKMFDMKDIKPNVTHKFLTELEKKGKLKAIVTQNIDNLHTIAGSKNVLELHGNIYRNYCSSCHKEYDYDYIMKASDIPKCKCGGTIKPDVVLYEEELDYDILTEAINYISNCDTLLVLGTSLTVYPAAGLIRYFKGKNLVIINKDTTSYDNISTLVINDSLSNIFSNLDI